MPDKDFSNATAMIYGVLETLLESYQIRTERTSDGLQFPDFPGFSLSGEASLTSAAPIVQLDILLRLPDGRVLCESCVGTNRESPSPSQQELLSNALASFTENSFNVLLAAFFLQSDSDNFARETMTINSCERDVYLGPLTCRYGAPGLTDGEADYSFVDRFFHWIEDWLKQSTLPLGDHWVRVYRIQSQGQPLGNEVLLDNEIWPEAESELLKLDWPAEPDPSDARVFLIIRDRG